ncbi:hypothetical protein PV11_01780 [Exophiala sideris]|uniref:DUF7907 domain-containing protein n=1 Tax=Exophiala sideris TaxID=1016849 RepID=A0A0D1YU65_9EURO|nr:hypothetical protein PV11_01780 [Exophiala sideris]
MHFTTAVSAAALSLFAIASASPILETRDTTPPAQYYLQTKVVNGAHNDTGSNKDGLYVVSYHTGAGLGDAGLIANKTNAWIGYLNGTQQLFTYPNNEIGPWPLAIVASTGNYYQAWYEATISIASEPVNYEGFFFNSSGLQYNQSVGGWLACDWWLTYPQLFNIAGYTANVSIPNSCSKVELLPIAV